MIPRLHRLFLAVLLISLFSSCSDDSTSPNDDNNNGNGGGGGGKHPFAIVSVSRDSVFWGDTVTVTLRNATAIANRLFIHTVPIAIDSAWRNTDSSGGIRFRVPNGATSGRIRIYEHDSVQATGSKSLFIYQQGRFSTRRTIDFFTFEKVYRGDIILIDGRDIPIVQQYLDVSVNGEQFEIVSWDSLHIAARVAPQASTGPLCVRMFDSIYTSSTLTILEPQSGKFLDNFTTYKVTLNLRKLFGKVHETLVESGDTVHNIFPDFLLGYSTAMFADTVLHRSSGDSLIFIAAGRYATNTAMELRLKHEPENRVSGSIRFATSPTSSIELVIRNMRWIYEDGKYLLRTLSTDQAEQVPSITFSTVNAIGSWIRTYDKGEIGSLVTIEFSSK